jgi:hypothetical protein
VIRVEFEKSIEVKKVSRELTRRILELEITTLRSEQVRTICRTCQEEAG